MGALPCDPARRLAEAIRRAHAHLAAGADGIFVPGLMEPQLIRDPTAAVPAPVNIMAGPGALTVAQLVDLGVHRVSLGTSIAQAAYTHARQATVELLTHGTCTGLEAAMSYAALNTLLTPR